MAGLLIFIGLGLAIGLSFRAWQHWRAAVEAPPEFDPLPSLPRWDVMSPVITGNGIRRYKKRTRADIARAVFVGITSRLWR
jgi:hypothetical protein